MYLALLEATQRTTEMKCTSPARGIDVERSCCRFRTPLGESGCAQVCTCGDQLEI